MQQIKIVMRFIACICRKDTMELKRILSGIPIIIFNQQKVVGDIAIDRIMNRISQYTKGSETFHIRTESHELIIISDGYSYLSLPCRISILKNGGICEDRMLVNVLFKDMEAVAIQISGYKLYDRHHCIATKEKMVFQPEKKIRILESDDNYVIWHCEDGQYRERAKIGERSKMLSERFVNVRKSHWVNMDYIIDFRWSEMTVFPDSKIYIPRNRYRTVKDKVIQWNTPDSYV